MPEDEETRKQRRDRELIELLNELRVAIPGVQVLFAFLLIVPFSNGFPKMTPAQRDVFFVAFLCTTASALLLIATSAHHRLRFRDKDKERLVTRGNTLALVGLSFLAVAMTAVVFLITDVLFGEPWPAVMAGLAAGTFGWVWYVVPFLGRSVSA